MSYVDMAVGTSIFLFFIALVLLITIQHFVRYPAMETVKEYREKSIDLFKKFFTSAGVPSNWESIGETPSELGLIIKMNVRPILVSEPDVAVRSDEPVIAKVVFDDSCTSKAWNNTIRIYDSDMTEVEYELVNPVFCSGQFLNESYVRFKVDITKNGEKTYQIYYYDDETIPAPNYTISYSTTSWVPSSGDAWADAVTSWSRYGGSSGSVETNNTVKMMGDSSIQIKGSFNSNALGLEYNPTENITGVSNGWYIDMWLYVDDLSGLSAINVSINDNNETIMTSISPNALESSKWYHFERELSSSSWDGWNSFNASNGIDKIAVYMLNSTPSITRQIKIDELHFELKPLSVLVAPEETRDVVSSRKIEALRNLTYEDLKKSIGEDYRFRIKILD